MAFVRSALMVAGLLALSVGSVRAGEAGKRMLALSECPNPANGKVAGIGGCIEMIMHWDFARTDRAPVVAEDLDAPGKTTRVLAIKGRLGRGPVRDVKLVVSRSGSAAEDTLGEVAYLGRSRDGRPIIVTDRGPLELRTSGLNVGRAAAVVIIDERAQKVVRSYLGGLSRGAFVLRGPDRAAAMSQGGTCLSPPESKPGVLTPAEGCGDRQPAPDGLAFSETVTGAISSAPDADLAMIRKLLPQTRDLDDAQLRARTGRLGATHHLVVTPWDQAK